MIELDDFKKYFNQGFWKAFKQAFPIFGNISTDEKKEIVENLYENIRNRSYYPSPPKTYLYRDKGNSITRSIPVFEIKDYCLYYYCIKRLEKKIAINRTGNTFGGWTLGGLMRKSEEDEIEEKAKEYQSYEEMLANEYGLSISEYSFNPKAWSKWYGDFNAKLYATSQESGLNWVAEFDISNFYDCIRLDLLEISIREIATQENAEEVSLLFHFLNYWNRKINAYNRQTVGIPQDALGDCSRILANFYLQEYDTYASELAKKHDCKYLRYADDQFLFGKDKKILQYLLFLLSKKLNCFGLNINQKKMDYRTVEELIKHRSFELFDAVREEKSKDPQSVESFLDKYFELRDHNRIEDFKNKGQPLLNKAVYCNIKDVSIERKHRVIGYLLDDEFLKQAKADQLNKLYELLEGKKQKDEMVKRLEGLAESTFHTAFHYEILKFLQKIQRETHKIEERIRYLENEH